MIHNVRALALALGSLLLLGGLMASSASATSIWFEGATGIQTVTASQEAGTEDRFTITDGSKVTTCDTATYSTDTATIDTTESELEVTPTYADCDVEPIGHAQVTPNGCDYRFYNPTTNAAKERTANVQITCPAGQHIEIEVTLFATFKCTITVGAQSPNGHAILTNVNNTVTINTTLTGITWTEHDEKTNGTKASGFGACTDGAGNDGTYNGVSLAAGRTHGGAVRDIWIDK